MTNKRIWLTLTYTQPCNALVQIWKELGSWNFNCGNQTAHEKWNARKWCSKTEEQKNCEIIKFDKNRCIRIILNEDTKCTAKEGRPGYEISYDWAISLMWYLMTEANSKFLKKYGKLNERKKLQFEKKSKQKKETGLVEWLMMIALSFNHPIFLTVFQGFLCINLQNIMATHDVSHVWKGVGEQRYHTSLWLVAKVNLCLTKVWMSTFVKKVAEMLVLLL